MTTTGSGVGGNVGGPQIPLQEDLNKTAWTEINKAAVGIVYDSIEQAFTQLNPRYTFGYLGGFGYRTSAENPLLDHPLENVRVDQSFDQPTDTSWQQSYDDLVDMLPDDMKQPFLNEAALPLDQRSEAFLAVDSLFRGTAQLLTQLDSLPETFSAESLQGARTALNQLLPFASLKGSLDIGTELMLAVQTFLIQQGANFTNFDGYVNTLRQMDSILLLLQFVNGSLSTSSNGQLSDDAIAAAERAAVLLGALSTQLESVSTGTDLQLFLSVVNTLEVVALALALPNTETSPLFFALALALQGAYLSDNSMGLIGPSIETLIDALTTGSLSSEELQNSVAGNAFLSALVAASFVFIVGASSLAVESGIGQYIYGSNVDAEATRILSYQAAMQMILSSGIATTFFNEIIALTNADGTASPQTVAVFVLLGIILADLTASTQANTSMETLAEWQRTWIEQGLAAALALDTGSNDAASSQVRVALETASIALQDNDMTSFNEAIDSLLDSLGISRNALAIDINGIADAAGTVATASNPNNFDQNLTGIISVV